MLRVDKISCASWFFLLHQGEVSEQVPRDAMYTDLHHVPLYPQNKFQVKHIGYIHVTVQQKSRNFQQIIFFLLVENLPQNITIQNIGSKPYI